MPVVTTALHTGFRLSERLSLTCKDMDVSRRSIAVKAGYAKNGESRRVPVNEMLTRTLEAIRISEGAVFRSRTGKPYQLVRTALSML